MARIRSIKPEFWTDPDVVAMPMDARLFFIGCWNHADDYGVLKDDPERLRLQIMPADEIDADRIVDELVKRQHLLRMVAPDGTRVLVVRTFCVHQKIDKRSTGRWGHPDDFAKPEARQEHGQPNSPPIPTDPAESPPAPTNSTPGLEGTGGENNNARATSRARAATERPSSADADVEFAVWWQAYPRKVAKAEAKAAHRKARRTADADLLLDRLRAQVRLWQREGRPVDKYPHAATWLNGRRWEDDCLSAPPPSNLGPNEEYR